MEYVSEPARKIPVTRKADVVVVGGGPAGVGAALSAAQHNANTILVEKFGNLGGTNTTGFMFVVRGEGHLAAEIKNRLRSEGYLVNLPDEYPEVTSNPLVHYATAGGARLAQVIRGKLQAFDPNVCAHVMDEMAEEAGVKLLLRSLFVDVKVENGTIRAVIIENASGRQAIEGKVVIDATGRGDVMARSGVPYIHAQNELGFPMPIGLMWKMAGVDYERLLKYQEEDPKLNRVIEQARARGELPYYRATKAPGEMKHYDIVYTGHAHPEMSPTLYRDELLFWMPTIHDWELDGAEKGDDLTRAEIHLRRQIISEMRFLKKYVPGFEKAHLSGIAPMTGIREGRHGVGEYVLTFDDVRNASRFGDVILRMRANDVRNQELRDIEFDIPYRCLLPKKIDNLLLAGDDISADHGAFLNIRGFENAMDLGEVAGMAAVVSVESEVEPREIDYPILKKRLIEYGVFAE